MNTSEETTAIVIFDEAITDSNARVGSLKLGCSHRARFNLPLLLGSAPSFSLFFWHRWIS